MPDNISPLKQKIEMAPAPEKIPDGSLENKPERPAGSEHPKQAETKQEKQVQSKTPLSASLPVAAKTKVSLAEIERILSEDLEEIYFQFEPEKQQEFKSKGEQTAHSIKILLEQAKVKVKKIAKLIFKWLQIIPGVNRFFLEKESKIKAEEIVKLKDINTQEH